MRSAVSSVIALFLVGACASFDGRGLAPGQATSADVERVMGRPAETRKVASGETWLYYPRQPFGRKMFVARVAPDGRLVALEQRLTDENIAKIVPGTTRRDELRDLLGPPYAVTAFPRLERDVWEYHMRHFGDPGVPVGLYVDVSPDGIVRGLNLLDETATPSTPG